MPDLFGNPDPMPVACKKEPAEQYATNCDLISNLAYKGKPIRRAKLEDGTEVWVVIDVIGAVTGSKNPRHYWVVTKKRMIEEGWDEVTNCYPMSIPDSLGRHVPRDGYEEGKISAASKRPHRPMEEPRDKPAERVRHAD